MRTRVKICGITSREDASMVIDAGVDAIGLVFYEKSPRFITVSQASEISLAVPAFVSCVALFKDADVALIRSVMQQVEVDLIQFHGSENADFCEQFDRPYIKALGMKGPDSNVDYLLTSAQHYHSAKALLLDGHLPGQAGGTGETFDWSAIAEVEQPVVLAGGLTPENIRQAIQAVQPFAVDVSSGVESAPGIKDKEKVARFMGQVMQQQAADNE
jgi:phosphoribosylanthranilate isomerase